MFTGIIEAKGIITAVEINGGNSSFQIASSLSQELKIDQSLAHNGVCLTVEAISDGTHQVTAIAETLTKTTLGDWKTGMAVNLERCLAWNGRLDGHIVQGHVDGVGICTSAVSKDGSWEYQFRFDEKFAPLIIEKGSISLNGISLTVFNVSADSFSVAIIPYTFEHTNMPEIAEGSRVNLEFDMVGKYLARYMELQNKK